MLFAQTKVLKYSENKIATTVKAEEKGDLYLLVSKTYANLLIYSTGAPESSRGFSEPIILSRTNLNEEWAFLNVEELKGKTMDSVESIQVIYDPLGESIIYGMRGQFGFFKIKFKEDYLSSERDN